VSSSSAIKERAQTLTATLLTCRDRIGEDPQYVMFQDARGYESVFLPDWEGDSMDIAGQQAYRAARVSEYVESVDGRERRRMVQQHLGLRVCNIQ